jgi:hypothetical protein
MTGHTAIVRVAIDLVQAPSRVRPLRSAPLPAGVEVLLLIASGDDEATNQAAAATGRPLHVVREAAGFYIEQILLEPDADSYRVLGATPQASSSQLRRHMALLLRWLHPDHDGQGDRSVFAARVTRAWNDLKTEERRAAYDRTRRRALMDSSLQRKRNVPHSGNGHNRSRSKTMRPSALRTQQFYKPVRPRGVFRRFLLMLFWRVVH